MADATIESWSKLIFDQLVEAGVTLFTHVPDFGNATLIEMADAHNETRTVLLTSEEEGVAICAGADLVGERAVLCMQSSGVGNCPNFLSLVQGGRFTMMMIVTPASTSWSKINRTPLALFRPFAPSLCKGRC